MCDRNHVNQIKQHHEMSKTCFYFFMLYRKNILILLLIFTGKEHVSCTPVPNSVVLPRISRSLGSTSNPALKPMKPLRLNNGATLPPSGKNTAKPISLHTANLLAAITKLRRPSQIRNTAVETKLTASKQTPSIRLEESTPIKAEHQPTALERAGHVAGLLVLPLMAAPFIPMFMGNGGESKTADSSAGESNTDGQNS